MEKYCHERTVAHVIKNDWVSLTTVLNSAESWLAYTVLPISFDTAIEALVIKSNDADLRFGISGPLL